jgi:Fur family peroxide stress response transcriptional regulator
MAHLTVPGDGDATQAPDDASARSAGRQRRPRRVGAHARVVLDALRAMPHHPTAAAIYDEVRRAQPRLGQATIYRALAALEGAGLVAVAGRDALGCHYDARTEPHDHAVCVVCGRIDDVERTTADPPHGYAAAVASSGYALAGYEVRYYGRCPNCQGA